MIAIDKETLRTELRVMLKLGHWVFANIIFL